MIRASILLLIISGCIFQVSAQKTNRYDLVKLFYENKLDTNSTTETQILSDGKNKKFLSTKGIVYLKDISFKNGTIEVDLRGKDVFLQSFLGIAFHGIDTLKYDVIYFRPFNFKHADIDRRKWSVQYMSMPDYDFSKLRKEHPLVYENSVMPVPNAADWFHASVILKDNWVTVFVNNSKTASLKIKLLNDIKTGKIGLWSSPGSLSSDFANLTITQ